MAISSSLAQEEYRRSQNRLNEAVLGRKQAQIDETNFINLRNANKNRRNQLYSSRINFERRIEDLNNIINLMLDEVDISIDRINTTADEANGALLGAVLLSIGRGHAQMQNVNVLATRRRSVASDGSSSSALNAYRLEIQQVLQAINDLNNQINAATVEIERLSRQISGSIEQQMSFQRSINNSVANMAFYRRHF